jgi:hypothetical protein
VFGWNRECSGDDDDDDGGGVVVVVENGVAENTKVKRWNACQENGGVTEGEERAVMRVLVFGTVVSRRHLCCPFFFFFVASF